jgi:hypothetical protein
MQITMFRLDRFNLKFSWKTDRAWFGRLCMGRLCMGRLCMGGILLCLCFALQLTLQPIAEAASSSAIRVKEFNGVTVKDYSGQSLIQVEFSDTKLKGANFKGADLRGAVFHGADLSEANLQGVDFTDGIGYITNFDNADLTNANFTAAMLLKATFKGTNITGADFSGAVIDKEWIPQLCKVASGKNPQTGIETLDSLGCP